MPINVIVITSREIHMQNIDIVQESSIIQSMQVYILCIVFSAKYEL